MRFSSSAHKTICWFLAALCLIEWSTSAAPCRSESGEPVLLLKYSSQAISDETSRVRFSLITSEIERLLDVQASLSSRTKREENPIPPEIDDATLKGVAARVSEAGRKMDRLENREAEREFAALEKELRKYRLGDATRPLLADIFMKMGTISLWDGNLEAALGSLKKARSLRPGFDPDPALFSPQFRQIWSGIGDALPLDAEILVESIPPGASIFVDDSGRGTTPRRLKIPASRPVRLRLEHPGFQAYLATRQWLTGDSERIEILMVGDREARIAGFLGSTRSEIREAAPIVSEMAKESGAVRVAFLMMDKREGDEELRVLAASASSPTPRLLGSIPLRGGREGIPSVAAGIAGMLAEAGWPIRTASAIPNRRPWYYTWWFLTGVGLLAAGAAVALGGGGGGGGNGGTSSSTSGVNF